MVKPNKNSKKQSVIDRERDRATLQYYAKKFRNWSNKQITRKMETVSDMFVDR